MPEHSHWDGPGLWLVLTVFGSALVLIGGLTLFVQHNCTMFHVCSDIVRDAPHTFGP